MTPDDARKLLGGYATGSLTEAERKALFEAALEDQELFDELAGEQVLEEVLDEPGARQRLLTALEPPRKHRVWLWVSAAGTLAIAVAIGIVVSQRTQAPPQQIAQVMKSPEPAAAPVAPPPPALQRKVSPAPPPRPAAAEPQTKPEVASDAVRGFAAEAPAAVARAENMAAKVSRFAFNYAVRTDGFLEIVPAAPGFLSVTSNGAVVFPSGAVSAGTPVRIAIPSDAASLVIAFSGIPGVTGSPVRSDETSGTVTDQDPPNARIFIQLFLKPATR